MGVRFTREMEIYTRKYSGMHMSTYMMPLIKVYWTYAGFYKASIASRDLECITINQ